MQEVIAIGDIHLQDDRPWSQEVAKHTINWITNMPENNPDNIGILLGDLTEKAYLSGAVYSMLISLFSSLKFKEVYILVGNHDGKTNKLGKPVLTYNFINHLARKTGTFANFKIVDKATALNLFGMDMLMLPHLFSTATTNLKQYESLPPELSGKKYTSIFGHFTNTYLDVPGEKIDITYLKSDYVCFGHIHNPSPEYAGSVIPNSIAEAGKERQIRGYKDGVQRVIPIPAITDYFTVKFPDALPNTSCEVPVYTISNCKDEFVAREKYGDIFIRRCIFDLAMDSDAFDKLRSTVDLKGDNNKSKLELFDEWVKTTPKATKELIEEARKYLATGGGL